MNLARQKSTFGFTLLELIVVIAVLGVLATVLLVALNPIQQFARGRDTGRISAVTQLGRAMEAYSASRSGDYPDESATWATDLVNAGEISIAPSAVTYSISGIVACTTNAQNGFCYDASAATGTAPVIVYARLEANANISRCVVGQWAYTVFSSADGRAGIVCTAASAAPAPGNQTFLAI